jgi:O-antigen ligase
MRLPLEHLPPWRWLAALLPATVAFFYGPIAFGGVTPDTQMVLDRLLGHSFLLWLCVLVLERRWPRLPLVLACSLGLLTLIGISQFLNPETSVFEDEPFESHIPWLPGSIESEGTGLVFFNLLVMMLAGLFLRDGLTGSRVRWYLFRIVALSGLVIAIIGIYQKAAHVDTRLWSEPTPYERQFFAAFRYHGNAASFLNLSWPAALVVWIRSRLVRPGSVLASLDLCAFLVIFGAVFVNSSKAGPFLAVFGLLLACWLFRHEIFVATTSRAGMIVMIGFLVLAASVVVLPGVAFTLSKWNELLTDGGSMHGRINAYRACLLAIRESGWFGTGVGSFLVVFPPFAQVYGIETYWEHAHQDLLQTIIEWGWIGLVVWGVVFGGAIMRLQRRMKVARRSNRPELTASAAWIALVVVLTHSLFDFPLQIPALQWLVVFYLAIAWSDVRSHREESVEKAGSGE